MHSDFFTKITQTGQCLDKGGLTVKGMPEFCHGHEVKFEVERSECLKDFKKCTEEQRTLIQ